MSRQKMARRDCQWGVLCWEFVSYGDGYSLHRSFEAEGQLGRRWGLGARGAWGCGAGMEGEGVGDVWPR